MPPLHEWLANRSHEVPDATELAIQIARAGAAGVSLDGLSRALGLPPESFRDILRALTATGQVVMIRANGEMRYRAAG